MSPAVIAAVLGVLVAGLLLLLLAAPLVVCLLVRRRRGRKDGYTAAKKDSKAVTRQMSQSNEMGLYEPINKQEHIDNYYEDPDSVGREREEKGYSQLIEDETIVSPESGGENGAVTMVNEFYRGGDDYNIYARPEVSPRQLV